MISPLCKGDRSDSWLDELDWGERRGVARVDNLALTGALYNRHVPTGGCNRPPFPSHHPTGWISLESTRCQTSLALSVPSNRHLILGPNMPTTVATHMVSTIRGSATSNFILHWKPLYGGTWAYMSKKKTDISVHKIDCKIWYFKRELTEK